MCISEMRFASAIEIMGHGDAFFAPPSIFGEVEKKKTQTFTQYSKREKREKRRRENVKQTSFLFFLFFLFLRET